MKTIKDLPSHGRPRLTTAGEGELGRYFTFSYDSVKMLLAISDEDFKGLFPPDAPRA